MMNGITAVQSRSPDTTQDAFFNGRFELIQPNDGSHRAGLDALLLSACVPIEFTGRLADFGAGSGAAGIGVACRNFAAEVDLVERNTQMATLASRSLKLPANRKLHGRIRVICADVALSGRQRENAGLANGIYDWVIMNPPFNDPSHRLSPISTRREAHVMGEGGIDPWLRSAAATLRSTGQVAIIYRPSGLGQILAAFQGRFGAARIIPIYPKKSEPANRILVLANKGAKGAASIMPGFVVHESDGSFTDTAASIFAGETVLA